MTPGRPLNLEWAESSGQTHLSITGWTESELEELGGLDDGDLRRRLALLTSETLATGGDHRTVPPVAGSFHLEADSVCFVPRFPFVDGMKYALLVHASGQRHQPEIWPIHRPTVPLAPTTEVVTIYPTAAGLPVNLLRVYVQFSAPMSEGWAARSIRVCRQDTGAELEEVFLPSDPELWDPSRQRLTMLLDPGRIKRGLAPNLEAGYPLVEGVPIRLIVSSDFRDGAGQPMKTGADRGYRIGPALRSRLDPGGWRLTVPAAGSRRPLVVGFDRPLDHGLLQHSLAVHDAGGSPLPGEGQPGEGEGCWRFTPAMPWQEGRHLLVAAPDLEDVAGNSPVRVFDRDITLPESLPLAGTPGPVSFYCPRAATVRGSHSEGV